MARIGMALVAAVLFAMTGPGLLPILICVVAAFLDLLDGWIARRTGQISRLGEHLDPLADKILTSVVFMALALFLGKTWILLLVLLLLLREWGMTWVRERFQQRHAVTLPASRLGKWKMLSQSLFGNFFLFWLSLSRDGSLPDANFLPTLASALLLILLLSYISAAHYVLSLRRAARQAARSPGE
jgi:CDP-diacylglycerol--glycerol-3-phosphate 3-phosphatidyltransferase